jgi:hypothetical protein
MVTFGCSGPKRDRGGAAEPAAAPADDPAALAFDLTWKNYNGWDDPESAVYLLNGEETGPGRPGFVRAIERIRAHAKSGAAAVVTVHPVGAWGFTRSVADDEHRVYLVPFSEYFEEWSKVSGPKVKVRLGGKDANGNVPPLFPASTRRTRAG